MSESRFEQELQATRRKEHEERKDRKAAGIAVGAVILCAGLALAEETPPQPPSEVNVAKDFEDAAPQLLQEWAERRPKVLDLLRLGRWSKPTSGCMGVRYFEFTDCTPTKTLSDYRIDVTKTDSVLTPFIGHLYVQVREPCTVRNAVPKGASWGEKAFAKIEPFCLGKTYEECITGGAKPAPKSSYSACTGGPSRSFTYDDEIHLTYRWSKGKWEFQDTATPDDN